VDPGLLWPLLERLPDFRKAHARDPEAQAVSDMSEQEMDIMGRYADFCGYEFSVLRRIESSPVQGITSQ
jgi:hypothetical protein